MEESLNVVRYEVNGGMCAIHGDELPDVPSMVTQLSAGTGAEPTVWMRVARLYNRNGRHDDARNLLHTLLTDDGVSYLWDGVGDAKAKAPVQAMLAAHYASSVRKEAAYKQSDTTVRERIISATDYFNKALGGDLMAQSTWESHLFFNIFKGELDQAQTALEHMHTAYGTSKPWDESESFVQNNAYLALAGQGCVLYHRGRFDEALQCFKRILRDFPSCPPTVRLAMGYCHHGLKRPKAARACWERVLQLQPSNVEAMLGLAAVHLNSDAPQEGMQMAAKAYKLEPTNARALVLLADYYFNRGQLETCAKLSTQAAQHATTARDKAQATALLARVAHRNGDTVAAFQRYNDAIELWPTYTVALYGAGQMFLSHEPPNVGKAIECFVRLLDAEPDSVDAAKMLGTLHAANGDREQALSYLERVAKSTNDASNWRSLLELAQLLDDMDSTKALALYERALTQMLADGIGVSRAIWNNVGVHRHLLANETHDLSTFRSARIAYNKALGVKAVGPKEVLSHLSDDTLTIVYNRGRLFEDQNRFAEAETVYQGILDLHPTYVQARIRLSVIARARGQGDKARALLEEVLTVHPSSSEAWFRLGNLHAAKKQWGVAQRKFEDYLKRDKDNAYAVLSLANIFYSAKVSSDRRARMTQAAQDYYHNVLRKDASNLFAANGLGILLAEEGSTNAAMTIFNRVKQEGKRIQDVVHVWVNLAHIHMSQAAFRKAAVLYRTVLDRVYDGDDPRVSIFLAKALYEDGRFQEAKRVLAASLHKRPHQSNIWYNLAVVQKAIGVRALEDAQANEKAPKPRGAEWMTMLQAALADMEHAYRTLDELGNAPAKHYNAKRAKRLSKECEGQLQRLRTAVEHARETALQEQERRRQVLEEAQRLKQQMEEEERAMREAKEREAAELKAQYEKVREEEEALRQAWARISQPKTSRRRKKTDKDYDDDDEDDEDSSSSSSSSDAETAAPAAAKKRRRGTLVVDSDEGDSVEEGAEVERESVSESAMNTDAAAEAEQEQEAHGGDDAEEEVNAVALEQEDGDDEEMPQASDQEVAVEEEASAAAADDDNDDAGEEEGDEELVTGVTLTSLSALVPTLLKGVDMEAMSVGTLYTQVRKKLSLSKEQLRTLKPHIKRIALEALSTA